MYGGRPRPPSMIERHYANVGNSGAVSQQAMGGQYAQQGYNNYYDATPAPPVAQYANYNPMNESPVTSPVSLPPYGSSFDEQGPFGRQPPMGPGSVLTRGNTNTMHNGAPVQAMGDYKQPEEEAHPQYANLDRASVTPFQAAQYAAISRQLNVPAPVPALPGTPTPTFDDNSRPASSTVAQVGSPFADPLPVPYDQQPRTSADSFDSRRGASRAGSPDSNATRVTSIPPTLPEIHLQEGSRFSALDSGSLTFPESAHPSPSPLAQSFVIPPKPVQPSPLGRGAVSAPFPPLSPTMSRPQTPQVVNPGAPAVPSEAHFASAPVVQRGVAKRETMYDDEDAYGGIVL
ncbi:hypothetical protein BD410DRAFT_530211 [Rickenella mellea]|uniref:Uncharacterized protein n=1 Tax=Rickenella mellea TaxID=50990 RepID=A0A4Y7QG60_9AGAM|nr:hypothetical protein BD410DRAFT_530211 [Rickenella mellea]